MIYLDDRIGSRELQQPLEKRALPVRLTRLDCGDAFWFGYGPGDALLRVGVEIKSVGDLLTCIRDGRFAGHQLRAMVDAYDVRYLVIEGLMKQRPSDDALLVWNDRGKRYEEQRGRFSFSSVHKYLATIRFLCGFEIVHVEDREHGTAAMLQAEYQWWRKRWQDHDGHKAFVQQKRKASSKLDPSRDGKLDSVNLAGAHSFERRVAKEFPLVSWERSADVCEHFENVHEMVNASVEEWQAIEGIGPVIAQKVYDALRKKKKRR